jgi:hypothetical protein
LGAANHQKIAKSLFFNDIIRQLDAAAGWGDGISRRCKFLQFRLRRTIATEGLGMGRTRLSGASRRAEDGAGA